MEVSSTSLNGAINLPSMYSLLDDLTTRFPDRYCSPRILVLSRTEKRISILKYCVKALKVQGLDVVMSNALMIVHGDPVASRVSQEISTLKAYARFTHCNYFGNANSIQRV